MTLERVDVLRPEPSKRLEPRVELPKRIRRQPIHATLRVDRRFHVTRLTQHTQVLRNRRLVHPELFLDLSDRLFRGDEKAQDRPAIGLGDDVEDGFHVLYMPHKAYACQGTHKCGSWFTAHGAAI